MGLSVDHISPPEERENVDWLKHISRVRNLGVVHSHMLKHLLHHLHDSKLVLCGGYLHHMMLVEIPSHHFHHGSGPDLDWYFQKTPETVSRIWICTRSGKISTEYIRLLFCPENIIFSNKLIKNTN